MNRIPRLAAGVAVIVAGAACAEIGNPSPDMTGATAAFESVPAGFSATSSSFAPEGDFGEAFHPHRGPGSGGGMEQRGRRGHDDDRGHHGKGRSDSFGFMMGGGMGREFLGEIGFGPGKGRGPFHVDSVGSSCVFSASTGVVTCGPITRGGLTILATATITKTDGTAQSKVDTATNKVVLTSEVSGTKTRRDSATSVIAHKSSRTITGLAAGSTQRTVDGTSVGTEKTTGVTDDGAFEALRTVNDTTAGIVIPLVEGKPTYPSAGRVSRNMSVTVTVGSTTKSHTRSEVVTYDGTATAKVVITQDGATKTCTMPLPRGKLVCN
ncbi:MAG TPA: hypothetical protein VFO55_10475 [Gemmatimonadaceae bacterium]|nr:hypothetical protein [Gemmatimonadaceae bacterium]